jgi:ssDNA-binding Zn-finger/Zn-ribbon topoisomerase 1
MAPMKEAKGKCPLCGKVGVYCTPSKKFVQCSNAPCWFGSGREFLREDWEMLAGLKAEVDALKVGQRDAVVSLEYLFKASSPHMLKIPSVQWFMERVQRALIALGSTIDLEVEPGYTKAKEV